jgi:hypothetical protein
MARIHIDSITCINQQEAGSDEIYFIFDDNGGSGNYTSGTMRSIDEEPNDKQHTVHPGETFSFTNTVDLDIFEDDPVGIFWGPSRNDEWVFGKAYTAPPSNGMYKDEYSLFNEGTNSEYKVSVTVWGDDSSK